MIKEKHKDEEYLNYIRKLPCCLCGHRPYGTTPGGKPRTNAAHHVNGRDNDYDTVPLCDFRKDPNAARIRGYCCHHGVVHRNMNRYRAMLHKIAQGLFEDYVVNIKPYIKQEAK